MVRYRDGWHEVKVGVVGGWNNPKDRLEAMSYVAAHEECGAFAQRFGAEAAWYALVRAWRPRPAGAPGSACNRHQLDCLCQCPITLGHTRKAGRGEVWNAIAAEPIVEQSQAPRRWR